MELSNRLYLTVDVVLVITSFVSIAVNDSSAAGLIVPFFILAVVVALLATTWLVTRGLQAKMIRSVF